MGGRLCRVKWLYPHTGGRVTGATGCRREVDVRSWYSGVCVPPVTFCNLSGHCSNKLLLGVAATVSFAIGMDFVSSIKTVRKKKKTSRRGMSWFVFGCWREMSFLAVFIFSLLAVLCFFGRMDASDSKDRCGYKACDSQAENCEGGDFPNKENK